MGLIKDQMKSYLEEDKAEYVYMVLGTKKLSVTLIGDSYLYSFSGIEWQTIGAVQAEPSAEIVSIFEANNVNGAYLDMNRENMFIPSDVRDDIELVIDDDIDGVVGLIKEQMKSYLEEDKAEYIYMILGTKEFSVTLNGDSYLYSFSENDWRTIGPLHVSPSDEILAIFEANGVYSDYLQIDRANQFIPSSVRDDIELVIDDDVEGIVGLIKDHMRNQLVSDNTEYAYMVLGTKMFSETLQ